jgi:hypothetical protein
MLARQTCGQGGDQWHKTLVNRILRGYVACAPMSDLPEEWVFLESAWRFALLLTGCHEGASKIFKDSVDELLRHPHPGDLERTRQLLFMIVRRRGLKYPARSELDGTPARLHGIAEPGRSALALLYLGNFPADDIQRVLNINERLLAEAIDAARSGLREERPAP